MIAIIILLITDASRYKKNKINKKGGILSQKIPFVLCVRTLPHRQVWFKARDFGSRIPRFESWWGSYILTYRTHICYNNIRNIRNTLVIHFGMTSPIKNIPIRLVTGRGCFCFTYSLLPFEPEELFPLHFLR